MNLDRELMSLGFVSDPQRKPMSFAYLKPPKKRGKAKRARIAPSQTYAARYKREMRARQIALGIIKPRTPEEVALTQGTVVEKTTVVVKSTTLQRVGSGPLAIWIPVNGDAAEPAVSTTTQENGALDSPQAATSPSFISSGSQRHPATALSVVDRRGTR